MFQIILHFQEVSYFTYLKWEESKEGKPTDPWMEYEIAPMKHENPLKREDCFDPEGQGARSFPIENTIRINKTNFYPICVLSLVAFVEIEEKLSRKVVLQYTETNAVLFSVEFEFVANILLSLKLPSFKVCRTVRNGGKKS